MVSRKPPWDRGSSPGRDGFSRIPEPGGGGFAPGRPANRIPYSSDGNWPKVSGTTKSAKSTMRLKQEKDAIRRNRYNKMPESAHDYHPFYGFTKKRKH